MPMEGQEKSIKQWTDDLTRMDLYTQIQLVGRDVEYIKQAIGRLEKANLDERDTYVTKAEFLPVKNVVFGLVSIILVAVVGAILTLVIIR